MITLFASSPLLLSASRMLMLLVSFLPISMRRIFSTSSMLFAVVTVYRTDEFVVTKAPSPLRKNSITLFSGCVNCCTNSLCSAVNVLSCASSVGAVESVAGCSGTGDSTSVSTSAEGRVEGGGGNSVPVCVPVSSSDSKIPCSGIDTTPSLRIVGSVPRLQRVCQNRVELGCKQG